AAGQRERPVVAAPVDQHPAVELDQEADARPPRLGRRRRGQVAVPARHRSSIPVVADDPRIPNTAPTSARSTMCFVPRSSDRRVSVVFALMLASALCGALLLYRVHRTGSPSYEFLAWNLFLAW